jgi:hypothetical protein
MPTPAYELYSPGQIIGSTLIGSALGGSLLIAANYRRPSLDASWAARRTER